MKHRVSLIILPAVLGLALIIAGCAAGSAPTATPPGSYGTTPTTSTPTASATGTVTATTTSAATFQSLAVEGKATYAKICAACHGQNGEGSATFPALWGSNATLGTYKGSSLFTDGQSMLKFISTAMPLTAPGSLTATQYQQLLAFILIQNNLVAPSTTFDVNNLGSIAIK